jgi:hypothetical protein
MRTLAVGAVEYRLVVTGSDGSWIAHAERVDNGDRFGIECAGGTEEDAIAALVGWLEWQHEHAAALEALQGAERAYHQGLAAGAFADPNEGASAAELQRELLDALEAARVRLDEVRERKPS